MQFIASYIGTPVINQTLCQYKGYSTYLEEAREWGVLQCHCDVKHIEDTKMNEVKVNNQIKIYISVSQNCYQTKYTLSISVTGFI